jgi:hypothetical protein
MRFCCKGQRGRTDESCAAPAPRTNDGSNELLTAFGVAVLGTAVAWHRAWEDRFNAAPHLQKQ